MVIVYGVALQFGVGDLEAEDRGKSLYHVGFQLKGRGVGGKREEVVSAGMVSGCGDVRVGAWAVETRVGDGF